MKPTLAPPNDKEIWSEMHASLRVRVSDGVRAGVRDGVMVGYGWLWLG